MFHVKRRIDQNEPLDTEVWVDSKRGQFSAPGSFEAMKRFAQLLREWQNTTSLMGATDIPKVWNRHILNSLQLTTLAPAATRWLDIGSGNGFPAVVIASALLNTPNACVHCVESDARKCAFLLTVARATGLPLIVHPHRIGALEPRSFRSIEAVTARAFAPLAELIRTADPYIALGAVGIFPLGPQTRLIRSPVDPRYNQEWFASNIDPRSLIVRVSAAEGYA